MRVADFAKEHQINIVSPVKLSNKILLGTNYVSNLSPPPPLLHQRLAGFMYDSIRSKNLLMVYRDKFFDRRKADALKKYDYQFATKTGDSNRISPIRELYWEP